VSGEQELPFAVRRSQLAHIMSNPPPPLLSDQATEDQIGLAVRAVGAAFLTAIAWLGFLTWGTLLLGGPERAAAAEQIDPGAAHVNLLLYGLSACLVLTGAVGWRLLRPVGSTFRRGGLAMVGVLGGLSLGMLATFMARELAGPTGLLATGVVGTLLAVVLARGALAAARRESLQ
jgi:hypothetical protein